MSAPPSLLHPDVPHSQDPRQAKQVVRVLGSSVGAVCILGSVGSENVLSLELPGD